MKMICSLAVRVVGTGLLIGILVSGCASSVRPHEQEGGITGTGNNIDCHDPANKKRKECQAQVR